MKIISTLSCLLMLVLTISCNNTETIEAKQQSCNRPKYAIVIHGGAGTILKKNITPEKEKRYKEKLSEALNAGESILKNGGNSQDAVIAAILIMEDSPLFNSGKGAVYTHTKTHELDASFMDGATLNAGAVAGAKIIKNPIRAARLVMTNSPHVLLSGDGAGQFAIEQGLDTVSNSYFDDRSRRVEYDSGPRERTALAATYAVNWLQKR